MDRWIQGFSFSFFFGRLHCLPFKLGSRSTSLADSFMDFESSPASLLCPPVSLHIPNALQAPSNPALWIFLGSTDYPDGCVRGFLIEDKMLSFHILFSFHKVNQAALLLQGSWPFGLPSFWESWRFLKLSELPSLPSLGLVQQWEASWLIEELS